MSKNPKEAMDFLNYVAEVSRGWDELNKGEVGKTKSQPNVLNAKAGMYTLNEDIDMKAKVAAMTRRLEELELKKIREVQAVSETPVETEGEISFSTSPKTPKVSIKWKLMRRIFTGEGRQSLITLRSGKEVELQHPSHMLKRGRRRRDKEAGGNQRKKKVQISVKYKDPGCPTISVMIGGTVVEKALLDLGTSVNLLPYSVYKKSGLGELSQHQITLSLADRSVKIPRGITEDVLVQVDNFTIQ
ncbi:hypothetical protein CK203_105268 [Vitis vinifera]|uniref:Uncharacterized protein n=1 Tax=Vitis vinifera TaxID=29760 RepID=A0A438FGQ6_VITVI|nr:hypothetical protein CK203_105268 [Vitis vinifera]